MASSVPGEHPLECICEMVDSSRERSELAGENGT